MKNKLLTRTLALALSLSLAASPASAAQTSEDSGYADWQTVCAASAAGEISADAADTKQGAAKKAPDTQTEVLNETLPAASGGLSVSGSAEVSDETAQTTPESVEDTELETPAAIGPGEVTVIPSSDETDKQPDQADFETESELPLETSSETESELPSETDPETEPELPPETSPETESELPLETSPETESETDSQLSLSPSPGEWFVYQDRYNGRRPTYAQMMTPTIIYVLHCTSKSNPDGVELPTSDPMPYPYYPSSNINSMGYYEIHSGTGHIFPYYSNGYFLWWQEYGGEELFDQPYKPAAACGSDCFFCYSYWDVKENLGFYPPYPAIHAHYYETEPETEPEEPDSPQTDSEASSDTPESELQTEITPWLPLPLQSENSPESETEKADKSRLEDAFSRVQQYLRRNQANSPDELTENSHKALVAAGTVGLEALNNPDATQAEVDAATTAMETALSQCEYLRTAEAKKLKAELDGYQGSIITAYNYSIRYGGVSTGYPAAALEEFVRTYNNIKQFYDARCAGSGNYATANEIKGERNNLKYVYRKLENAKAAADKKGSGKKTSEKPGDIVKTAEALGKVLEATGMKNTFLDLLRTLMAASDNPAIRGAAKGAGLANNVKQLSEFIADLYIAVKAEDSNQKKANKELIPLVVNRIPEEFGNDFKNAVAKNLNSAADASSRSKDTIEMFDRSGDIDASIYRKEDVGVGYTGG